MANQVRTNPQIAPDEYSYGENDIGSREIFVERQKYDTEIFPDTLIPNFMETWTTDRFYGLVNTKGNTVVVDETYLKPLRYTDGSTLFALNFVADAWGDFCTRLRELSGNDQLYKNSPWSNPNAIKGWDSIDNGYREYMTEIIYPAFNELFLAQKGRDKKIRNINSFMAMFEKFMDEVMISLGPLTRSGFIESNYISPLASGLMIEISADDYSNDFTKSYEYKDDNFQLVARIAQQYGFAIDKNIPWRFIADLRNPAMQEYMYGVPIEQFIINEVPVESCEPFYLDPEIPPAAFGYSQIDGMRDVQRRISFHFDDQGEVVPGYAAYQGVRSATQPEVFDILFSTAYNATWDSDVDVLIPQLVSYYNTYVAALPVVSARAPYLYEQGLCPPESFSIVRSQIELEDFSALFEDRWRLRTFYHLRRLERSRRRSREFMVREVQKIMNIYNLSGTNGYRRALRYTQEEFVGPYDTDPLTMDTVGDIIRQRGKGEKRYAFPDTGRQD